MIQKLYQMLAFVLYLSSVAYSTIAMGGNCTPRSFSSDEERVLKAYIGYYGRPADVEGLSYWAAQVGKTGSLAAVIDGFGNSSEFTDKFGNFDDTTLVNNIYQQAFGRGADSGGLSFYVGELSSGRRPLQSIALDIIFGAQNEDLSVIQNKLLVSEHLITQLENKDLGYVDGAGTLLDSVTSDAATAEAACSNATALLGSTTSQSFAKISGTVSIMDNSFADSDTNDSEAAQTENNSPASAQQLPPSGVVGGYVALAKVGDPGGYAYENGDPSDWYRLDAGPGTSLILSFPNDPISNDLDLYLYDASGSLLNASVGTNNTESLTIDTAGSYYVEVRAYLGGSIYNLRIGVDPTTTSRPLGGMRLSDPFVPGEIIVVKDSDKTPLSTSMALSMGNLKHMSGTPSRPMLYCLETIQGGASLMALQSKNPSLLADKLNTLLAIKELRRRPGIKHAAPNFVHSAKFTPNDQYFSFQWDLPQIGLTNAWDITQGDQDVIVAVIDTGVLLNHPDLQGQLVAGADFISNPSNAGDGDGIDNDPNDPGDGGGVQPSSFHGTHVAGTIAAATDNSIGVAGIAPRVRIMPLRVLGIQGGTDYDIAQALLYAAGLDNDLGSVPAKRADIVNMSLGGPGSSQFMQNIITQVRDQGVIIIAAAGNESTPEPRYPAAYDGVVSVSATAYDKSLAPYSNFGSTIDIAAPGGNVEVDLNGDGYGDGILSTLGTDDGQFVYKFYNGTSMAAPHVAGIAALMKSVYPAMTPDIFDTMIASGKITEDLGAQGRDDSFGYGLINAIKSVQEAQLRAGGQSSQPPILGVDPSSLNFGTTTNSLTLTLRNKGGGALSVSSVSASETWISIAPAQVDAQGLGAYTITVDRSALASGTHRGSLAITSNLGTTTVNVVVTVFSEQIKPSVGQIYILLLDESGTTIAQVAGVPSSLQGLSYSFDNVSPGNYQIVAGTDMNQDNFICDAGEACGAYPNLDMPTTLTVDTGNTFVQQDFTVGLLPVIRASNRAARHPRPQPIPRRPIRLKKPAMAQTP